MAVRAGLIVDGSGSRPLPDGVILVAGGHVVEVGPAGQVAVPPDATVLDAGGRTVIPGVIESHVHIEDDIPALLRAFVSDGVTTVANTGSTPGAVRRFHEAGELDDAARGFIAGPTITAPGGYPSMRLADVAYGVEDENSARAAVRHLAGLGIDFVKVALEPFDFTPLASGTVPVPTPAAVRAVVAEARELGLPVRAHVRYVEQLEIALDAGVTSVEHMLFPLPDKTGYADLCRADRLRLDALPDLSRRLERMVGQGVYVVPTIGTELANIGRGLAEPRQDSLRRIEEMMIAVLAEFVGMGGRVALGSDWVGLPGFPPGMPRAEMACLARAGLSPLEVVEAGTRHAAVVCGQGDVLGVIAPGRFADLVVLDGDPRRDLRALDRISAVVKNGKIVASRDRAEVNDDADIAPVPQKLT